MVGGHQAIVDQTQVPSPQRGCRGGGLTLLQVRTNAQLTKKLLKAVIVVPYINFGKVKGKVDPVFNKLNTMM
jgi:hypothetical protein